VSEEELNSVSRVAALLRDVSSVGIGRFCEGEVKVGVFSGKDVGIGRFCEGEVEAGAFLGIGAGSFTVVVLVIFTGAGAFFAVGDAVFCGVAFEPMFGLFCFGAGLEGVLLGGSAVLMAIGRLGLGLDPSAWSQIEAIRMAMCKATTINAICRALLSVPYQLFNAAEALRPFLRNHMLQPYS
jgi:hypothetical protein